MQHAAPSTMPDAAGQLGRPGRWWAWGQGESRRSATATVVAAAILVLLLLLGLPLAVLVWPPSASGPGAGGLDASSSSSSMTSSSGSGGYVNLANLFFWNLKQTAKEVIKEEAALVRVDPERVDEIFAPLEPVMEALGVVGDVRAFNAAWDGLWLRRAGTCLADDTDRLQEAIQSPKCNVVLLVPGGRYELEQQINVTMSKTLIGSPAERSIIDASAAERAFFVSPGVMFDVRHLLFYEGDGDIWRDEFRTRFGGVIYLRAGASLFTFDCLYTIQAEREPIFNDKPEMIFGGDILMEGGTLTAVACSFFAIVPGFVNSISTEVGGSVLILGGTATFTLVNFMTTQIFAFNVGVGMHIALLGGALNMAGCTHTANLVFAAQGICGRNIYVGAGVGIFTGIAVTDTMGLLAFFGAGLSIHVGAGLAVWVGSEITLINAVSAKYGVAVGVAVGAGMGLFYGVAFAKDLGITHFSILGVFVFVGAGRMAYIGSPFAHQNAIASWQLLGGAVYLGAGDAVIVGSPFARVLGLDFFVGLGGDIAVMAGHLTYIGSAMTTSAGIGCFIGQGSEVFVGAGSAAIHGVSFSVNIGVHFYTENVVGFYVAGRECEVKTEESEEGSAPLFDRGYGTCSHGGGEEGEIDSHVVVQGLKGRQRFGGWRDELEPLSTGPATLYIGPNVSSCALCGLEGVRATGPGVEEGGACPAAGEEGRACPEDAAVPVPAAPVLAAAATAIAATTVVDSGPAASTTTPSGGKKGLFGFGGRLRRFLSGEGGAATANTTALSGEAFVLPTEAGDDELPDTHVLVVDLSIWCHIGAEGGGDVGCPNSTVAVQHALERTWLGGFEEGKAEEGTDGARVVVTQYKSPSALKATLGIPALDGDDGHEADVTGSGARRVLVPAPTGCGAGAQELVFVAYAHTTDKATADALKARVKAAAGAPTLNATLGATLGGDAVCAVESSLRQTFYVPAPASKRPGGAAPLGGEGGLDFAVLPRVWVNITSPVVEVGRAYDVTISHFDQGDRVGLHLVPSPRSAPDGGGSSSSEPLFFQTAPRLLHTFRAFDEGKGNATWTWAVSPLLASGVGPGPFFLKAFDTKDPGRFVLSQAFDIATSGGQETGAGASGPGRQRQRQRHRRAQGHGGGRAHAVLRKLSSTQGGEQAEGSAGTMDDVGMMQAVLSAHKNKAATADFWRALLAMPSAQKALGDAALARTLLQRAPVLRSAPEVAALDEAGGWGDAGKVRAAMVAAIGNFADMALRTMRTSTTAGQPPGTAARDWPTRVLESLTPEEAALARQVARDGDVGAMGELMDSQAAQHFGGITMAQVKDPAMVEELRGLFMSSPLLRELIDDQEIWKALDLDLNAAVRPQQNGA